MWRKRYGFAALFWCRPTRAWLGCIASLLSLQKLADLLEHSSGGRGKVGKQDVAVVLVVRRAFVRIVSLSDLPLSPLLPLESPRCLKFVREPA